MDTSDIQSSHWLQHMNQYTTQWHGLIVTDCYLHTHTNQHCLFGPCINTIWPVPWPACNCYALKIKVTILLNEYTYSISIKITMNAIFTEYAILL